MKAIMTRYFILLIGVLLLAACSRGLTTQFNCQQASLKGCMSLTAIDAQIDQGRWPPNDAALPASPSLAALQHEASDPDQSQVVDNRVQRQAETIKALWIAPFEDVTGNYHYAQWIDVVTQHGVWQPLPVRANHALD